MQNSYSRYCLSLCSGIELFHMSLWNDRFNNTAKYNMEHLSLYIRSALLQSLLKLTFTVMIINETQSLYDILRENCQNSSIAFFIYLRCIRTQFSQSLYSGLFVRYLWTTSNTYTQSYMNAHPQTVRQKER